MRTFVLALGVVAILSACASEPATPPAEPKPVLILSEWNYPLYIGHPWPIEVRLVAYDNGAELRLAEEAKVRLAAENAGRSARLGSAGQSRRTGWRPDQR